MSKKNKQKIIKIMLLILILICLLIALGFFFFRKDEKIKVVDEIENYGYVLTDNDTKLMKELFNKLEEILTSSDINYDEYAEYLGKLFITDLFSLDSKVSKYDIGGIEYIYPDHQNNFKLNVQNTLYAYLEKKDDRKETLPLVTEIEMLKMNNQQKYIYQDKEYLAYQILYSWKYKEDNKYDTQAEVTLMKKDNKLYVVEYHVVEE